MIEEWRPVVGHEGRYEVSNLGRVRSLDCVIPCECWDKYALVMVPTERRLRGKVLRPGPSLSGHLSVVLGRAGGSKAVHLMVLEAFVGPCPDGHEGCHWDDDPSNNKLGNLRWGTRSSNLHDAVRNGKKPIGEKHHFAKLKNSDISLIRAKIGNRAKTARGHYDREALSLTEIGREFGVSGAVIRAIKDQKTWKHIP